MGAGVSVIHEIADAIKRNSFINKVIVSECEMEQIHNEYLDLQPGGPIEGDARKWALGNLRLNPPRIMGRPVYSRTYPDALFPAPIRCEWLVVPIGKYS